VDHVFVLFDTFGVVGVKIPDIYPPYVTTEPVLVTWKLMIKMMRPSDRRQLTLAEVQ